MAAEHPHGTWDDRRFRPNILFDDDEAGAATIEDDWFGSDLLIGKEVRLHVVAPTPRCVMINLEQDDLGRDNGILRTVARANNRTLGELGKFACAGAYAEVVTPGVVRAGDAVRLVAAQSEASPLAEAVAMLSAGLSGQG